MSRASSLRQTLGLSSNQSLEVLSIEPSGDCLYDCIHALISRSHDITHFSSSPLLLLHDSGIRETSMPIPSSQTMREYVANQLGQDQFDSYQMYASAGVEDYSWMASKDAPKNLEELKEFAKRSGKRHGPGQCLWADEYALRVISDGLQLSILIVDDQAQRGRGPTKRKRDNADADADGRFISIGLHNCAVILHRSRREHFNGVVIDGSGTFDPRYSSVASLWPMIYPTIGTTNQSNQKTDSHGDSKVSAADTASTKNAREATQQSMGRFFCGCAGFSNSNWVGIENFYPIKLVGHNSDRQLGHYQEHFSTVEVNSTFYGVPSESTVLKWKSLCSKAFQLVVKVPKGVTHERERLESTTLIHFMTRMNPLRENLVCILIQCPRTLVVDVSQLDQLKSHLKEGASWYLGHVAFEFRNSTSFHDANVREFLCENKWTLVIHPDSLERSTIGSSVSGRGESDLVEYEPQRLSAFTSTFSLMSSIIYIRLHGTNDEHRGEYNPNQLGEISEQIHNWRMQGFDIYCFFLNDLEPTSPINGGDGQHHRWAAMPKNAKQLEKLVFDLANEQIPDAPKKPKATLLNYFSKK